MNEYLRHDAKVLAGFALLGAVILVCMGIGSIFGTPGALVGLGLGILAAVKLADKYGDGFMDEEDDKPAE